MDNGRPAVLPINDSLAWDGSPAFSRDGKTLYFASNRAGGIGGIDIYRTNIDASGRFSRPVNMGRDINTVGDDMFPYVAEGGKLYFASDGHPGLGKLDLFSATRTQGVITIENMGLPFNSPQDDFGLVFYQNLQKVFLRQTAMAARAMTTFTTSPDQRRKTQLKLPSTPTPTIRLILTTRIISTANQKWYATSWPARLSKMGKHPARSILLWCISFPIPRTPRLHNSQQLRTASLASSLLKKVNLIHCWFSVRVISPSASHSPCRGRNIPPIFLTKELTDTTFNVTIKLDKLELNKTFVLENIYYDLNKYNIRPDAAIELDKLVQILKDNPTMTIELSSHTDARATDAYNMTLSQNRAESAVAYLNTKGIDADRMVAKGYGERELIVPNAKTEEEHQRNRRTEFTILSY